MSLDGGTSNVRRIRPAFLQANGKFTKNCLIAPFHNPPFTS